MSRVLKGRYFSSTNILLADKGNKPSFAWSSILHGQNLLKKGLRFVVGNGISIHLWKDNWLPLDHPRPPRYINGDPPAEGSVNDFMIRDRMRWNEDLIRELVDPEDVATILQIKLNFGDEKDLLGWHYTDSGLYSVKSGYWVANHHPDFNNHIIPPHGNVNIKQGIWKTKTAPKIKHFLWRLSSNSLGTGAALHYRHIIPSAICKRCCGADETIHHLFFLCPYAQAA